MVQGHCSVLHDHVQARRSVEVPSIKLYFHQVLNNTGTATDINVRCFSHIYKCNESQKPAFRVKNLRHFQAKQAITSQLAYQSFRSPFYCSSVTFAGLVNKHLRIPFRGL